MNPPRRALIGLGAVGVVMGALMAVVIANSDHTNLKGLLAVLSVYVAWSFIGTGLYAWDRRPDNLIGPLMVALGFRPVASVSSRPRTCRACSWRARSSRAFRSRS